MSSRRSCCARRLALECLEPRYALATYYVSTCGADANNGASEHPLGHAAKGGQHRPGRRHRHRPRGQLRRLPPDARRHGRGPDHVPGRGRRGRSRSETRRRPTASTSKGPTTSRSRASRSTACRGPASARCSTTTSSSATTTLDHNGTWGILTGFSDDLLIENNVTTRSQVEHGIYVSNSGDRPVIRNNVIWGNRANGIHMNGDVSAGRRRHHQRRPGREQRHLRQRRAAAARASTATACRTRVFRNNLIYNNHASGISLYRIDGGGGSTGNLVVNNTVIVSRRRPLGPEHPERQHRQHRPQQHPLQPPLVPRQHRHQRRQPGRASPATTTS